MTTIRVDPHRPPVDTATLRCPSCRQTLAAILDGGEDLPPWHRRWATNLGVRIDNKGGGGRGKGRVVCDYNGDDLARLVFIAQVEADR